MIIIVFGVSGCGKTTIGKLLAKELKGSFYDADDFHSPENIEKMSQGIALTDQDRKEWLLELSELLKSRDNSEFTVLACSALKEKYRNTLCSGVERCKWVWLKGSYELIRDRIRSRESHFMDDNLLHSQFETLEEPNYGLRIDISEEPSKIVKQIRSWIQK